MIFHHNANEAANLQASHSNQVVYGLNTPDSNAYPYESELQIYQPCSQEPLHKMGNKPIYLLNNALAAIGCLPQDATTQVQSHNAGSEG